VQHGPYEFGARSDSRRDFTVQSEPPYTH
jgi:hypothetical protein